MSTGPNRELDKLSSSEWEDLCHRCGYCCTVGDDTTGRVACRLFDLETHSCKDYANRLEQVPWCRQITPKNIWKLDNIPDHCGYKQYARGQPLEGPKVNAIPVTMANGRLAKILLSQ